MTTPEILPPPRAPGTVRLLKSHMVRTAGLFDRCEELSKYGSERVGALMAAARLLQAQAAAAGAIARLKGTRHTVAVADKPVSRARPRAAPNAAPTDDSDGWYPLGNGEYLEIADPMPRTSGNPRTQRALDQWWAEQEARAAAEAPEEEGVPPAEI